MPVPLLRVRSREDNETKTDADKTLSLVCGTPPLASPLTCLIPQRSRNGGATRAALSGSPICAAPTPAPPPRSWLRKKKTSCLSLPSPRLADENKLSRSAAAGERCPFLTNPLLPQRLTSPKHARLHYSLGSVVRSASLPSSASSRATKKRVCDCLPPGKSRLIFFIFSAPRARRGKGAHVG